MYRRQVLGYPPVALLKNATKALKYFNYVPREKQAVEGPEWILKLPSQSSTSKRKFVGAGRRSLQEIVMMRAGERSQDTEQDYHDFLDLVSSMLKWRAEDRITPLAALNHPFFNLGPSRSEGGPSEAQSSSARTTSNLPTGPMLSDRSIRSMEESGATPRAPGGDPPRGTDDPMAISPHASTSTGEGSARHTQPRTQQQTQPTSKVDKCLQVDRNAE